MTQPEQSPLEDLPYETLRERAFAVAESRRDLGFFVDLVRHLPSVNAMAGEGGSLGDISATLTDAVGAARELAGEEGVGDLEPLFRARFATYIREHEAQS
jgi:hypothetical protein